MTDSDWKIDRENDPPEVLVKKLRRYHVGCTGNQRVGMTKDILSEEKQYSSYLEVPKYSCCAEAMLRYVLVHSEDPSRTKDFEEVYKKHRYSNLKNMLKKVMKRFPDEISTDLLEKIELTEEIRNITIHEFCFVGADKTKPVVKSLKQLIGELEEIILKYFETSNYFK